MSEDRFTVEWTDPRTGETHIEQFFGKDAEDRTERYAHNIAKNIGVSVQVYRERFVVTKEFYTYLLTVITKT